MSTGPLDLGLARERTVSAWTRTALALVVNGGLVLVRHELAFPLPVSVAIATVSLVLAGLVLAYAGRRSRTEELPDREIQPASRVVVALGVTVTLLCLATACAVLLAP